MPSLGEKLAQTQKLLEEARITAAAAQAEADANKIRAERLDAKNFVNGLAEKLTAKIEAEKSPVVKVTDYGRQAWIRECRSIRPVKFKELWTQFEDWAKANLLEVQVVEAHDAVGMKSWLEVLVRPSALAVQVTERLVSEETFGREIGFGRPVGREIGAEGVGHYRG